MNLSPAATPGRRRFGAALLLACLLLAGASRAAGTPDAVSLEAARAEHEAGRAILIDIRPNGPGAGGRW